MTNNISLRFFFNILGKIFSSELTNEINFKVPVDGYEPVYVEMMPNNDVVISTHKRHVSTVLLRYLKENDYSNIPTGLIREISTISSDITSATKEVLNLIKYCMGLVDLDESLLSYKERLMCNQKPFDKNWECSQD